MCKINYFKAFVLCSCDVSANVDHLCIKRIYLESLVGYFYMVREDKPHFLSELGFVPQLNPT
jgi:hypothetical protein